MNHLPRCLRQSALRTPSGRLYSTNTNDFTHVVIGGGVVGLAVASKLASHAPSLLLERHKELGTESSSRNSEVIHAGIYYPEGSLKSTLCIRGKHLMYETCEKYDIPHKRLGKWILAQNDAQGQTLQEIYARCLRIGVPMNFLSSREAAELEPEVRSPGGVLNSPTSGIVSSHDLMTHLRGRFEDAGGDVSVSSTVCRIRKRNFGGYELEVYDPTTFETQIITTDTVINSAGLGAVKVSNMLLPDQRRMKAYYCKGNYFSYSSSKPKVGRLLYPCPVAGHGGLGTHLTLDLGGKMRFGPDVEWVEDPTDLEAKGHRLEEAVEEVAQYLPGIDKSLMVPDYAGIRAKLVPEGADFQDFVIREEDKFSGFVNLLGIESPGLTSSLAIAEMVEGILYK